MSADIRPDLMTARQVCAKLGISEATWWRWRQAQATKMPTAVTLPSGRQKWKTADIEVLAGAIAEEPQPRRRYFSAVYRRSA